MPLCKLRLARQCLRKDSACRRAGCVARPSAKPKVLCAVLYGVVLRVVLCVCVLCGVMRVVLTYLIRRYIIPGGWGLGKNRIWGKLFRGSPLDGCF